jgi:hypothetical protein
MKIVPLFRGCIVVPVKILVQSGTLLIVLSSTAIFVRIEVFTAVTVKNAVVWKVTPLGIYKNWRFGGTHHLHFQGGNNQGARNNVTSNQ